MTTNPIDIGDLGKDGEGPLPVYGAKRATVSDLERLARAMATGLGDDFDHAFASKSDWNAARGESGGRYRDINEPMQDDYLAAASAFLTELREPSEGMIGAGYDTEREGIGDLIERWQAMIDHILADAS